MAQRIVGHCYFNGKGVQRDDRKAAEWFRRAAEQGEVYAQRALGWCYELGRGVPMDLGTAHYWYCRAAVKDKDAAANRDRLARAMSPDALLDGLN